MCYYVETADADCLMHGKGTGDPFDIMVGEMRRPMLINTIEEAIMAISSANKN